MHGDWLLRLSNHHASAAPVIEERPGRYLGYFVNKFGEQLGFMERRQGCGEKTFGLVGIDLAHPFQQIVDVGAIDLGGGRSATG